MNAPAPLARGQSESPREQAAFLFERLRDETSDETGVTRECYAASEAIALDIFRSFAEAQGLKTGADRAGNMIIMRPGDDGAQPGLFIGSHADSVPQGGNFDGAAGVVAALLCLVQAEKEGRSTSRPVRAIILRGEESAFYGRANIGSRALFGMLSQSDLAARRRGDGRTLGEAMASCGIDIDPIARGERLLEPGAALGFLELHIEQGPVMTARGWATAVVTGIRGNIRHRKIVCAGEAGHSGAVPRWLRHDPVFAFADLIMRLDEHWRTLQERGLDLVVTSGVVGTNPREHALSRIPGEIDFSFEVRSQSHDTLEAFYELFRSECRALANERQVTFAFDNRIYAEPARMDEAMIKQLSAATRAHDLPVELAPSGAGHDAAIFASAGVPSGMLFVRNSHGSHNPAEAMDIDDFLHGFTILYDAAMGFS